MNESQKLRVRIGEHEFEAEGPPELVQGQFDAWRELISRLQIGGRGPTGEPGADEEPSKDLPIKDTSLSRVFQRGEGKIITLRVLPTGDRREADAILLLLYGFHQLLQQDDVLVGRIKNALGQSGLQPDRIDRGIAPYVAAGLVRKGGRGPGGRYRLSNTGVHHAEGLVRDLA